MSFLTRAGLAVDLDSVEAWTVRPLVRPAPADDLTSADDRDQAVLEIRDWSIFPFEVMVETEAGQCYLFGSEARAFVAAQLAALAPWLR